MDGCPMSYSIDFSKYAQKVIKKWKKSNKKLYDKLYNVLLPELMTHPRTGLGHPEPLVGGNDVTYSRHITGKDVIIYDIYDDAISVLVVSLEGHYDDK